MPLFQEEYFGSSFEVVTESKKDLPPGVIMRVRGPIGITEKKNRNGRLYSNKFWRDVLERSEVKQAIKERAMVGAADHPKSFVPPIASISHVMVDAYLDEENNALVAESDILDTPMGRIVKTCFDAKLKLGSSTRGASKTNPKSVSGEMQSDGFKWGGYDFCFEPSAQNAYQEVREQVEKIITESATDILVNEQTGNEESTDTRELYRKVLKHFGSDADTIFESVEKNFPECVNCGKKIYLKVEETEFCPHCNLTWNEKVEGEGYKKAFENLSKANSDTIAELEENKEKLAAVSEALKKKQGESPDHKVVDDLERQLEATQKELKESKEFIESVIAEKKESEEKIKDLNEQLERLEKPKGFPYSKVLERNREVAELRKDLEHVLSENEELKTNVESFEAIFESKEKTLKKLSREAANLRTQIKALRKDLEELNEDRGDLRIKYYSLKTGITESKIKQLGGDEMTLEQADFIFEDLPKKRYPVFERAPVIAGVEFNEQVSKPGKRNHSGDNVKSILTKMRNLKR